MNVHPPHLNLLKKSERLSSSPVRLRVMAPVLAGLACVGVVLWWGALFMQSLLVENELKLLTNELDRKKSAHSAILERMARVRELNAQLEQLSAYRNGRPADYGAFYARLAEIMPAEIQLLSAAVPIVPPPAAPQQKGKGATVAPPTELTETPTVRLVGKTTSAEPVKRLMDLLGGSAFTNVFVTAGGKVIEPKIHTFRQENSSLEGKRLLEFDIEYACTPRRFAK